MNFQAKTFPMKTHKIIAIFCFGILWTGKIVLAQGLTNQPIFETNSIKVVTNEKFPQDLESEIFVGPKGSPYFHSEGTQSKLESAEISLGGTNPSICVFQKGNETNSYVLYLFTSDAEGKVLGLFDLNMDGVWDVKRTPTREQKNFIFFDNLWVAVIKIDGLKSANPTAEAKGIHYEFRNSWKLIK